MSAKTCFTLSDGTLAQPSDPFFIVGSGRCGTTLMRRLVIERTHAIIPPENYVLAASHHMMTAAGTDWHQFCRLVLTGMRRHSDIWDYLALDAGTAFGLLSVMPDALRSVANFWHAFHAIYARQATKPSTTRWGDKTPSNIDGLAELIQIFPSGRFIFLVRDVFDMAYSFGSMPGDARSGRYLDGARRWVDANARMLAFREEYGEQTIIVRYEALALQPDVEMARVLLHLDATPVPATALTSMEARDIAARPHLRAALGEVSGAFIGKGRASLPDKVKQEIRAIAAPLQVRLGYDPTGEPRVPLMAP